MIRKAIQLEFVTKRTGKCGWEGKGMIAYNPGNVEDNAQRGTHGLTQQGGHEKSDMIHVSATCPLVCADLNTSQ